MSTTNNPDSVINQGQFKPAVPRDEPLTTKGHQPGRKVAPADHAPEFSAKVLPPGSAPPQNTFTPNPQSETPGQANNAETATYTSAADTLSGADSAQVHTGLGHPGQGQTSAELRHDGEKHRKKQSAGLQGVGAQGAFSDRVGGVDERIKADQRALEREEGVSAGQRGDKGALGAEDQIPEGADTVAAEAAR